MTIWCWVHGWRKIGIPCKLAITSFGIPFFTSSNCYLTVPRLCVVLDFPLRLQNVSLITNLRPRHFLFWFGRALLWTILICLLCRSPQPPEAAVHLLKKYTIQLYFGSNNTFVRKKYRICFDLCRKILAFVFFFIFKYLHTR